MRGTTNRYSIPRRNYASDTRGRFIGPYSPEKFLNELMHIKEEVLVRMPQDIKFTVPQCHFSGDTHLLERQIYQAFLSFIKRFMLSPNMHFFICVYKKKPVDNTILHRPDIGTKGTKGSKVKKHDQELKRCYLKELKELKLVPPTLPPSVKLKSGIQPPTEGSMTSDVESQAVNWCRDSLLVEGHHQEAAGQREIRHSLPVEDRKAKRIRGQLALYASEIFAHQQRSHLFQLLVCDDTTRFIFWDHSGAITSDSFDYTSEAGSMLLAEFFWRLNRMSDEARGVDITARGANDKERSAFTTRIRQFIRNMEDKNHRQRSIPNAEHILEVSYPVCRISVKDEKATRGYVPVDKKTKEVLLLRDTWRFDHPFMKIESEVYRILELYGVPHVPSIICGRDVKGSDEQTHVTRSVAWADTQTLPVAYGGLRDHTHHRIVQRLAYPIESAVDSKEYATAFRDALLVIEKASASSYKVLHRHISIGNVMVCDEEDGSTGLLSDWDDARVVVLEDKHKDERQKYYGVRCLCFNRYNPANQCTPGYVAVHVYPLASETKMPHEILDDCEAIFWTMLYGALHRFKHEVPRFNMSIFREYDEQKNSDGTTIRIGGRSKMDSLHFIIRELHFASTLLRILSVILAQALIDYYTARDELDYAENFDSLLPPKWKELRNRPTLSTIRKTFEEKHAKLSDPSFWRNQATQPFKKDLCMKDQDGEGGSPPFDNGDVGCTEEGPSRSEDELDGSPPIPASQPITPNLNYKLSSPASSQQKAYLAAAADSAQPSHTTSSASPSRPLKKRSRDNSEDAATGPADLEPHNFKKKIKLFLEKPASVSSRQRISTAERARVQATWSFVLGGIAGMRTAKE
ncbi:hypothetical protein BC835DRAFT_1519017 [Cytidiella melzeri]|nr:hypothetical protein BC835DRAFT_1519017 [Cytidiella melzeri]